MEERVSEKHLSNHSQLQKSSSSKKSKEFNLSNVQRKQEERVQKRMNNTPMTPWLNKRNSRSADISLRHKADSSSDGSFESLTSEENDHFDDLMKRTTEEQQITKHGNNQMVKRPLPVSNQNGISVNRLNEETKEIR